MDIEGKTNEPLGRLQDEVVAENKPAATSEPADGSAIITLVTRHGEGDIRVPPMSTWGSFARSALFRNDDFMWAQTTLSPADFMMWAQLDPTLDESQRFFMKWGQRVGEDLGKLSSPGQPSRSILRG